MIDWFYRSIIKPLVRTVTPSWVWKRYGDAIWFWHVALPLDAASAAVIGWPAVLRLRLLGSRSFGRKRLQRLKLAGFPHRLYYRPGTSDPDVIRQVFGKREYQCVLGESAVEFIIDCGANVGCTSLFLLHHYPNAKAVIVEPDADNLRVCRRNLAPFAARTTFVNSGVWSESVPLVVEHGAYSDGRNWAIQVRPARPGETPHLTAITLNDLLAASGFPRFDIVKVDIEAAEVEVFSGPTEWLNRTRTIVIELHGPECERVVSRALAGRFRHVETSGELTVYRRIPTNVTDTRI